MADYFSGWISIGGDLARSLVPEFLETLRDSGAGADWDVSFSGTDEASLSTLRTDGDGTLRLYDNQASYGHFDDLEVWCREHDLAYDRYAEARYEFDAEYARWRPGWEEEKVSMSDQEGGEWVPLEDAISARRLLVDGRIEQGLAALDQLIDGRDVVPLVPPFKIVD